MTLQEAVAAAGIKHAHIVDDAFDKLPGAGLPPKEINTFINEIDEKVFADVAKVLGVKDEDADVIAALNKPEGAAALFIVKEKFGKPADTLFQDFTMATQPEKARLEALITFLDGLGVKCHKFGRSYSIEGEPAPQLLFVDLKLNEKQIVLAEPIGAVLKMKREFKAANPLVFLMSTQEQALKAHRVEFRDRCELFSSQFEDLPKRMIATEPALRRFIAHHVDAYPRVVQMRKHIESWESAMDAAKQNLLATFRRLDLPDYFVLHQTAAADEVEFGGFLIDLMLGYVGNEIERSPGVAEFADSVNKIDLKNLKRSRFNVEPVVGDVFAANIVYSAARLLAEKDRKFGPEFGHLSLGDIFFPRAEIEAKQLKKAWVVLTPACDLARPKVIEQRDASIVLCEGSVKTLTPTTDLVGQENLDKVILRHGEKNTPYAIDWRKKRIQVWDIDAYKGLKADPKKFGWVHVGRMRPIYALQLQRVVFGDLERVGTMRRLTPYAPCGVEVLVPRKGNWFVVPMEHDFAHDPSAGALSDNSNLQKKTFILSDVLLRESFESVAAWAAKNGDEVAAAKLKTLCECDEALDRLMFHVLSTKERKPKAGETVDTNVYPLLNSGLPDAVKAALEKSVAFATANQKPDEGFASGKPLAAGDAPVLVFRFLNS